MNTVSFPITLHPVFTGWWILLLLAIGAGLTLAVFDRFIIIASAFGGAGLAMDGTHQIFRSLDMFDRATIVEGAFAPAAIWMVLGTLAVLWQLMNIERWKNRSQRTHT